MKNIVYMGTPEFAVPALKQLAQAGYPIQAVFCQPDRPKGRSKKLVPCPVKQVAESLGIPVHQPKRIRAKKWQRLIHELEPDLIVVAAFGQILPQTMLDIPKIDCLNIHASLLPRWRGASPIQHAILEGDEQTGVAIMRMELELDAGPVYRMKALPIPAGLGRVQLEAQLSAMGADLLLETLPAVLEKRQPQPQDEGAATFAPIIEKHFGYFDFQEKTALQIERLTLAFEGWPGVHSCFHGHPVKLIEVKASENHTDGQPGTLVEVSKKTLAIACAEGTVLYIRHLQPVGKKVQPVAAFINGYHPELGEAWTPMRRVSNASAATPIS